MQIILKVEDIFGTFIAASIFYEGKGWDIVDLGSKGREFLGRKLSYSVILI